MAKKQTSTSLFTPILFTIFFLIALVYRSFGIWQNHPFWVDEFSSSHQARLILNHGWQIFQDPHLQVEQHNFIIHALIALSFQLFGLYEWSARLPFVLIGSFIPLLVYLLARNIFNARVAVLASLLTMFSYFQITWSRQARGYVVVQFLILVSTYIYLQLKNDQKISSKKKVFYQTLLALCIFVGFYTHALYLIFLCALITDAIVFNRRVVKKFISNLYVYLFVVMTLVISYYSGHLKRISEIFTSDLFQINNVWYYHSFLWREYGLITFLALFGFIASAFKKMSSMSLVLIYTILHLVFINLFFSAYVSRYLLPIFPFLFIASSYVIVYTLDLFLKQQRLDRIKLLYIGSPVLIALFIIGNGHKFVATKPRPFYSVNRDFREIALIDYNEVYNVVKSKGNLKEGKTAVVDTWPDRLYWYLGEDYQAAYIFRWIEEPGKINGLLKKTVFKYNEEGEKVIPNTNNLKFIGELSDLKKALAKYPRGFIFIDDTSLPSDVQEYVKANFKKELYLDHYPLDDNPYSIWPATLYSWGIER